MVTSPNNGAPLVLRPGPWPSIALLVGCIIFVALGILIGLSGRTLGFLVAGFFGLGIPVAVIRLIPGSTSLHIDDEGFTTTHLFRKHAIPWSDIDGFHVVTVKQSGLSVRKMVGFDYAPGYDRSRMGRALAQSISGCEGALADTYGQRAEALAAMLNERVRRFRASAE